MPDTSTPLLLRGGHFCFLIDMSLLTSSIFRGVLLVGGAISPFTAELLPIKNDHLVPNFENNHLVTSVENNNSMILTLEHEWLHHCTIEVGRGFHGTIWLITNMKGQQLHHLADWWLGDWDDGVRDFQPRRKLGTGDHSHRWLTTNIFVTFYQTDCSYKVLTLQKVRTRRLPDLLTGRDSHACGTYMLGGIQVE